MSTWGTLEDRRQRPHSLSNVEDVISQKIQRQGELTSEWSIPATHGSPSTLLKMKQSPTSEPIKLQYSKLMSIFQDLDRQCQERSSRIELDAREALRTQLNTWIKSREKLYLTQLRDASEQFRKMTLEAVKQRQAAEYSQALSDEKNKLAEEYHCKIKEVQDEREQLVQRRIDLVRQMEEAAAVAGQRCEESNSQSLKTDSQQKVEIDIRDINQGLRNEIKVAEKEASCAKEELIAAIRSRDQAQKALENARNLQEKAIRESKILEKQFATDKIDWKRDIDAKEHKVQELKTAAEGARVEISSLKAELHAVQLIMNRKDSEGRKITESETNMLIERAEAAEAAAEAAQEAKEELERCIAAAEAARTAAESQASHLRQRLQELIKENNALQKGMAAAEEALRAASIAETATAADHAALIKQVAETKQALAAHRTAISQLESQLIQERTQRESLQAIAKDTASLQAEAAAWEEKTLRHAEDTRLRLAAALRDIEAVCLAARALGHSSSSSANTDYTAPLLSVIKESEESAAEATVWLREARIEGKALASSAPCSSQSSSFHAG